jgi:hydrogenase maturation protein HypF
LKTSSTWHIHIQGQVQGVGFRPFVYQLAIRYKLKGWVKNTNDGVHINFNADKDVSKIIYGEAIINAPQLSHITSHSINEIDSVVYEDFKIIASNSQDNPHLLLSPDFAMCESCRKEISDKSNRRYSYTFTTCTQCGPRYSIIKQLPYDRENTVMEVFKMCKQCNGEYNDPTNRRHFSQTNSCPDCPVEMKLYDNNQNIIEEDQANIISIICTLWNDGKILAIKGIGGFLLTCDASNEKTIQELRKRKHRPAKPFALLFPDINSLHNEAEINEQEKKELESTAAPIILLQLKENTNTNLALHSIAPKLSKIGVMLPYAPLYQLLLQQFEKPIIATSGNISNAPIVFEDTIALNELNAVADYILVHNREIIAPQDDSVVTYSRYLKQRIVLRRARGFAPLYIKNISALPQTTVLAMGAMLKSSFTLLHQQNIHISQYLGDTDNYDAQKNFENNLYHFLNLFKTHPEVILADKHPGYFTSQLAEKLARQWNISLIKIQHHEAHFASVLGEHDLLDDQESILGIVWDGTGYGDDGQIWGGEFLIYYQHKFSRTDHFEYFNHFLEDKMSTEPRLSAFSLCKGIKEASNILQPKFSPEEWDNYNLLIKKNKLKTSSAGRIFDAVSSLLGLIDKASYEGEAAMLLEEEALRYFKSGLNIPDAWLEEEALKDPLSTESLMYKIVEKINGGKDKSEIAAWFHVQLVLAIVCVASQHHCHKICFSGGVFQNALLIDLSIKILGDRHQLYFNKDLSPNDENISFGQLMCFAISEKMALQKKV